jgi:hypothetical protein
VRHWRIVHGVRGEKVSEHKETQVMRWKNALVATMAMAVLTIGSTAFAGQKAEAKGTVVVRSEARLGDQTLAAGKYVAEVLAGDEPILVLSRDGKEVARASVQRHETPTPMPYDQIRVGLSATGTSEVVSVTFKGRRDTFTIRSTEQIANSAKP